MRVRARTALRPYYNYRLIDIAQGEEVAGGLAVHLLETGSDVEPADDAAQDWAPPAEAIAPGASAATEDDDGKSSGAAPDAELDIDGTADAVLAWVGDDPERAGDAIELETAKDKPRQTLLKKLGKIAESGSDE
ncbi:hypothetical protein OEIGOIKO_05753 [Streptomyces chrestomyceticus JCM 4735]|uniref:Uncharacterized protein n=1 Tax=Streptomyces chrestomyceticus JCM 4735 TaxID=1306181 RepID=A0A7U9PZY8_9ACTN|nr:hypothetical protein [Streptomyces chrestomyceticus]GCD37943.1 hypothetical protein OEIGOIKO_05753 [Streptomyces chrestomyceticus JCM 4735]